MVKRKRPIRDLTGTRFGMLRVKSIDPSSQRVRWICVCDCGGTKSVRRDCLVDNKVRSCGCLHKLSVWKHGKTKTSEYTAWSGMMSRCYRRGTRSYPLYGGRGISVCKRWHRFDNFLEDMGHRPSKGHSLDRLDNDKDYSKANCRWADLLTQANNKRKTHFVEIDGERMSVADAARKYNVPRQRLKTRVTSGWPIKLAISAPPFSHMGPRGHDARDGKKS